MSTEGTGAPAGDPGGPADPQEAPPGPAEAARSRTAFLAHMRHELRTPLNAILGYAEMLIEDLGAENSEQFVPDLRKIHAGGQALLGLVNDVLNPSRLQSGGAGLDREEFWTGFRHDLRTPLNHVLGYCELLMEEAVDLERTDVLDELRRIHSAGEQLLALIDDLIRFSRIEAGTAEAEAGSFGVSEMIYEVVRSVPTLLAGESGRPSEGGSILVVDDNAINRDLVSRRLERQGCRVSTAENGREALERIYQEPFDLVLLDMMMPELNGYQVLAQLKADPGLRHIPVIMLSALDEIDSVVRCIEAGADDYLTKPFNPVLLQARVGACLEKKRLRDRETLYIAQIQEEKRRSDDLLRVILPDEILEELKATNRVRPRLCDPVAVLFCDIVGFTPYCEDRQPEDVIAYLQELVEHYEGLTARHGMQKIKTIGDAFMATAGLLRPMENPVLNCVRCGLEMITTARDLSANWTARVGIHVGPVIAGVVGHRQYLFDLWGDTVNTANRVETHGKDGAVNLSGAAWRYVSHLCDGHSLGVTPLKGKGDMELFQVERLRLP